RHAQKPYVENILYRRGGWSWITEGDARTLVGLSKVKSIYQQELTGDLVKRTLAKAAPLARGGSATTGKIPGAAPPARESHDKSGKIRDAAVFTATKAGATRGLPVWEIDRWKTL